MPNQSLIPQNTAVSAPTSTGGLDPTVLNLAKSIRQVESGNNYHAKGADGEVGAYQITPGLWDGLAPKYGIQTPLAASTPQEQNAFAYNYILDLKNEGYNPVQVATIWNGGKGALADYNTHQGTSPGGAAYNTPKYATDVYNIYNSLKQGIEPQQPQNYSVGGFANNVLTSGANFIGNTANALIHPIQTVQNIGSVAAGGFQELGGQQTQNTQMFDAFKQYFANRYGGAENIGNTVYNDPVGFLADLSTFFTGAGGIAGGVGKLGTLSKLEDVANVGAKASEIANVAADLTNPLTPVIAGAKAIGSRASTSGAPLASQAAGFMTGAGSDAATALYQAAQVGGDTASAARAALKGDINPQSIVDEAYGALETLAAKQSSEYSAALAKLKDIKGSQDISPVLSVLDNQLTKFGIKVGDNGVLDFSRSTIPEGVDATKIQQIYDTVQKWGLQPGDRTPVGLDVLKRRIGNYYNARTDGKPLGAFITPIKQEVRKVLGNVPGYNEMSSKYGSAEQMIDELSDTFSLSGKAKEDTVFRKLIGTLRSNDAYRVEMLDKLSEAAGTPLKAKLAGASFAPYFARGLRGQFAEGVALISAIQGIFSPHFLGLALATSPRLMGEFILALGGTSEQASKVTQALTALKAIIPPASISQEIGKSAGYTDTPIPTEGANTAPTQ